MTQDEIARLRELDKARTQGEWLSGDWHGRCHLKHQHGNGDCIYDYTLSTQGNAQRVVSVASNITLIGYDEYGPILTKADATYIVAACNALPRLLDEIERLRDAIFHIRERTMWHPDCAKCGEVYRTAIRVESGGHAGGSEALQRGAVSE